jgi:hypothetical protein
MMDLRQLKTQTTWEAATDAINHNSGKINEAVTRLENATYKNKGYFKTEEQLRTTILIPTAGSKAYVGASYPYKVYLVENGTWVDSGETGGSEEVNLEGYFTKEEFERLSRDLPQEEFDSLKEQGLLDPEVTYNTYEE